MCHMHCLDAGLDCVISRKRSGRCWYRYTSGHNCHYKSQDYLMSVYMLGVRILSWMSNNKSRFCLYWYTADKSFVIYWYEYGPCLVQIDVKCKDFIMYDVLKHGITIQFPKTCLDCVCIDKPLVGDLILLADARIMSCVMSRYSLSLLQV